MALDPNRQLIEIAYSETPAEVPTGLEKGELGVNLVDTPPRLYVGASAGPLLLAGAPAEAQLPTGGAQYDVLSKASATDRDVTWARMVRLSGDTMTGALNINAALANNVSPLKVVKNATVPTLAGNGDEVLWLIGNNDRTCNIVCDSFADNANRASDIVLRRAIGTAAAPAPVVGGPPTSIDVRRLGAIHFAGLRTATAYAIGAQIISETSDTWSSTENPSLLRFTTKAVGDGGLVPTRMTIGQGVMLGQFGTGTPPLADMGPGTINTFAGGGYFVDGVEVGSQPGELSNLNIGIGVNALAALTSGFGNIAIGWNALAATTSAMSNVGLGNYALSANISGTRNVAIGPSALAKITVNDNNTGLGCFALANLETGASNFNTALGHEALTNLVSGERNTAIGNQAGRNFTSLLVGNELKNANRCIYLGDLTFASADNVQNEIVIGQNIAGRGSNTITLGSNANTALYIRAGLVLGDTVGGDATGGLQGHGTVNAKGLFIDGARVAGIAPISVGWTDGTDPNRVVFFINNTGRDLVCAAITGVVEEPNGSAASVHVYYAPAGTTMLAATEIVSTTAFNANGTAGVAQPLRTTPFTVAAGGRLGLRVVNPATTDWDASIATITAYF